MRVGTFERKYRYLGEVLGASGSDSFAKIDGGGLRRTVSLCRSLLGRVGGIVFNSGGSPRKVSRGETF